MGDCRGDGNGGMSPRMTLILRTMKKHMGWEDAKDDYVVLDGEKSVGRIYKEIHGDPRWCWSINTSPYLSATAAQWRHHNFRRSKARIQNPVRGNEADGREAI
jgi:hypothetical protein